MRAALLILALILPTAATARPGPYWEDRETYLDRQIYGYGPAYRRNDERDARAQRRDRRDTDRRRGRDD